MRCATKRRELRRAELSACCEPSHSTMSDGQANEVDDVRAERRLTAAISSPTATIAQKRPKRSFRIGRLTAHRVGACCDRSDRWCDVARDTNQRLDCALMPAASRRPSPARGERASPEHPVHEPFRPRRLAAPEAFAIEPEAAALQNPRRGNSRASGAPARRHQGGAMRSGPSMAATSCSTRRQRKRNGGPSGTSASASIGSGRTKSRKRPRVGASRRARRRLRRLVLALARSRPRDRRASATPRPVRADALRRASRRVTARGAEPRAQPVEEIGERAGALGLVRALNLALAKARAARPRDRRGA